MTHSTSVFLIVSQRFYIICTNLLIFICENMAEESMFHGTVPDGAPDEEFPQNGEIRRDGGEYFND